MLRLAAKPRKDNQRQHGNGIMYGGGASPMTFDNDYEPRNLFYVETDFGNRMKLTWNELNELYEIIEVVDYKAWRQERSDLIASNQLEELPILNGNLPIR